MMTARPERAPLRLTLQVPGAPLTAATLRALARRVLTAEGVDGRVGIYAVDARTMAQLNTRLRGKRGATDVLTLCYTEGAAIIDPQDWRGEIWLCGPVLARQARAYGVSVAAEWRRCLVHGLLHLAGYEHEGVRAAAARRMRAREDHHLGTER